MELPEIISACLKQDRRAQARLYREFAPYSLAVVRRFGVPSAREADLLQEIFIEVFAQLGRFDASKGSFKTWLRQITVFRIIDLQRREKRLGFESLDSPEASELASPETLSQLPPAYLRQIIADLPTGYRTVFNLFAIEGFQHDKIGELLGISAAGSRSQYHRARKLLQTALKKNLTATADETR